MTQRGVEANRVNSRLSKGPRTQQGKARSSRNSIKDGFFSRLLYVAEADRENFERLRAGIEEQLQPKTVLQRLQADAVIDAAWRCKQASELDARYLKQRLSEPATENVPAPAKLTITEWYASNPRAMREAVRLIDFLIPQVRSGGRVPDAAVEDVQRAFGPDFYQRLEEWEAADIDTLWLADDMIKKANTYDLDLKRVLAEAKREASQAENKTRHDAPNSPRLVTKVVKDSLERAHMVVKLLEQKREQILELQRVLKYVDGDVAGPQASEPPCRYVGWAFRQLEKALECYQRLVEAGL